MKGPHEAGLGEGVEWDERKRHKLPDDNPHPDWWRALKLKPMLEYGFMDVIFFCNASVSLPSFPLLSIVIFNVSRILSLYFFVTIKVSFLSGSSSLPFVSLCSSFPATFINTTSPPLPFPSFSFFFLFPSFSSAFSSSFSFFFLVFLFFPSFSFSFTFLFLPFPSFSQSCILALYLSVFFSSSLLSYFEFGLLYTMAAFSSIFYFFCVRFPIFASFIFVPHSFLFLHRDLLIFPLFIFHFSPFSIFASSFMSLSQSSHPLFFSPIPMYSFIGTFLYLSCLFSIFPRFPSLLLTSACFFDPCLSFVFIPLSRSPACYSSTIAVVFFLYVFLSSCLVLRGFCLALLFVLLNLSLV